MNSNSPPTTVVHNDGMTISFREHTLHIASWRHGLAKLATDLEVELDTLCYGDELGLTVPSVVPDDWTDETRGYSWTTNDLNNFGLLNDNPLLYRLLQDCKRRLAITVNGKLRLNKLAMTSLLEQCGDICKSLFLLVLFTAGQLPRITELGDYKHANSSRGRNMFHHDGAIWFLNQQVKSESLLWKELSIASKTSPRVTKLLEIYFLLVRPVEKALVYHLEEDPKERKRAYWLYAEYMWVHMGVKIAAKDHYSSVADFMRGECEANVGVRSYRQICVEIGRVFLGSEAEIEAEECDFLALQMGHSLEMARSTYALEAGHLPGMSSDLLLRFGRISEAWLGVIGFKEDTPPLEPLSKRKKRAAEAVTKHQAAVQELLAIAALLRERIDEQAMLPR